MAASTARITTASIISIAVGTMPAAMMSDTACEASSMLSKTASSVRTSSARRSSRTVMRVTMPRVPSDPTSSPVRS